MAIMIDPRDALEESAEMLSIVMEGLPAWTSPDAFAQATVRDLDRHFTPGLVRYRKSVTEAGDFAALEWSGEGSVVRDPAGREWIDCLGGYGIYNLGIRHPEVVEAVRRQLDRNPLPTQELLDPVKGMLCRLLAGITPGDIENAFLCNSGTEAVEGAMKIARVATGRRGFVCAERAFHGKTLGALSLMGKAQFREPVEPLLAGVRRVPFGDAGAIESLLDQEGDDIAAVVLEPIQGEAGAIVPPDDYFPRARAACDAAGTLLVADEVQTGLGRTGALWAVDHWNVVPDILCVAKSLGGGVMPAGAILGRGQVWKALEANPFLHTSTFGGNPLACAASIAAIHVTLRERLWEQAARKGERFTAGLRLLAERYPGVLTQVRGRGLLIGMVFPDDRTGYEVAAGLFRRGVLVAGTQVSAATIRIEPALNIPDDLIDAVLARLAEALADTAAAGGALRSPAR
ncbi:MAG: aminotransferase class III-fold pyridoxal phosphate-dependent enzyme [Acidobacteria bacterium]|nr:aminotransferase class III-fold pyridoxal phosphate-dependent enzyme [Acidobacteriota bacterium]